jgi:DNA repair protein RAD7
LIYLNPNLTHLRLDYCGQIDDVAMKTLTTSLPSLVSIELLGPFLVRVSAWNAFLSAHPNLTTFKITQSPRFDITSMQALADSCGPNLVQLRLKEVGKIDDEFLDIIQSKFPSLEELDISDPGESCSQSAILRLLESIGPQLRLLDLSRHASLKDSFLKEGLHAHTGKLRHLTLSHLPELTDKVVGEFFSGWDANPPLNSLTMARNPDLGTEALNGVLEHSGRGLEYLNINGWKDTSADALHAIAKLAPEITKMDVGWCREVDDFVVKDWLEGDANNGVPGCGRLKEIKVWGCNKITVNCRRKVSLAPCLGILFCSLMHLQPGVNMIGVESQIIVS